MWPAPPAPSTACRTSAPCRSSRTPSSGAPTCHLTATGVVDADGTVSEVRFYRDANANGVWDAGDTLLDTDTDGGDGWSVTSPPPAGAWAPTPTSPAPSTTTAASARPPRRSAPSPPRRRSSSPCSRAATRGVSQVDGITMDTTPTFDFVVNDPGPIQIDWDNNGTFDASIVSTGAGTYSLTSPDALRGRPHHRRPLHRRCLERDEHHPGHHDRHDRPEPSRTLRTCRT